MGSGEIVRLYDSEDQLFDEITLPSGFGDGEPVRRIISHGRKFVEGGKPGSFYGKGEFGEVDEWPA